MANWQEDIVLDCSGLNCPLPVLKTKKIMDGLDSGQVLKMISTDPGSVNDVAAWAKRTGNELLETVADAGEYTHFLKKRH